jgi:phage terminase small subunit
MAGVKGRSGGARPNTGGWRPGAGRPPNPPVICEEVKPSEDPRLVLLEVMNNTALDMKLRLDAAKALMPYMHSRKGEGGKKGERKAAAQVAAMGRFAPADKPRLIVNNA